MNTSSQLDEISQVVQSDVEQKYAQLRTFDDSKHKVTWCLMNSSPRPCFNPALLADLAKYIEVVKHDMLESEGQKYDFLVIGSDVENIFNLGGDLDLFIALSQAKDKQGLYDYAISCIDILYQNIVHLECDLTTISLVQGDALGGGFETALASNVLIAEKGSKLGLPEVLFNMIPGMGAFSILSRKVGTAIAEKIILSGKLYTAEELHQIGVVDILAERGEGHVTVYKYIQKMSKLSNSYQAMRKVKDIRNDLTYQELIDITNVWVDTVLKMNDKNLKMIGRIISKQTSLAS